MERGVRGRAREVAGHPQDDACQDDADDDGARRDEARVARMVRQIRGDAGDRAEGGGQVDERGGRRQGGAHQGGDVEAPVDGPQAALRAADPRDRHPEERDERADRGDDEREHQALLTECRPAEDQGGHEGDRVGLEQVRGHAGAVAHVVAHVVGDRGGVAGVVLRDVLLHLAHEVRAHVRGLGEDAPAHPHEHGEQGRAETEALEHRRCVHAVDQHHAGDAQQAEAHHRHPDDAARAERDPRARGPAVGPGRRRGDPDVRPYREPHAEVADRGGEARPEHERDGPADPHPAVAGEQHQEPDDNHREQRQRAELPVQVGRGTLLDRGGDLPHARRALVVGEDPAAQDRCDDECHDGDRRNRRDNRETPASQGSHPGSSARRVGLRRTTLSVEWVPRV